MKKIWEKTEIKQQAIVDEYCFKENVKLDNNLVVHDVIGSIAHAQMLSKIGIITGKEYFTLKKALIEIIELKKKNQFIVSDGDEDIHTKVEAYLTDKLGDLGKKIHTGRSRNDQVLLDLRLFAKEKMLSIALQLTKTAGEFVAYAKKYEFIPMPGYTHMQKAMPSSVGMWMGSFAEQFLDTFILLETVFTLNDQSPLGSGTAYGVSLPIDRELTAKILGFAKVQNNSLYAQISRPAIQLVVMNVVVQIMLAASRFAQDMLLFTTSEFNFFDVDESICTGSSIMPQKKNLDVMEFVRAKTQVMIGYQHIVGSVTAGLPSGYNADFGETKEPLMKSFEIGIQTLELLQVVLLSIKPNILILKKACTPELYATHAAYELVKKGTPFREAYLKIGKSLHNLPNYDVKALIKKSNHTGATGKLNLVLISKKIKNKEKKWQQKQQQYQKVINTLFS